MASSADFERAVAYISSSSASTSSETKLRLYALYKIARTSVTPSNSRPGMFDFTGRAKWDAWNGLGGQSRYEGEEGRPKAKEDYVEEAVKMGMRSEAVGVLEAGAEAAPKCDPRHKGNKEAMIRVSMMADEQVDDGVPPSRLHELCINGDVGPLDAYLKAEGTGGINKLDGYGFSPLGLATDRGHVDVVKLLLGRGADRNLRDQDGNTPLQLAEMVDNEELVSLLRA